MTKEEALTQAKANYETHHAWMRASGFRVDYDYELNTFGFRHGWYRVGEFNFSDTQVTGVPYDSNQGGWAWV